MLVSNLQISRTLRLMPFILGGLVILDLGLYLVPGLFGDLKVNGYVAIAIPAAAVLFYSYVGFPIFTFDAQSEVVKIRSHLALSQVLGKSRRIPKMNITDLNIDRSGIRNKLEVTYLSAGREISEKFSITLLSRRKMKMLEAAVEDFHRERSPRNLHYFI
jgi:hypothetical protein